MKHKSNPKVLPETTAIIETKERDTREEKFLDLLFTAKSIREAGLLAGYSKEYCQVSIYAKFKSPRIQEKIIQRFKDHCYSDLPLVQMINRQGLKRIHEDLVNGNGDLAAKLKHIPRQVMEITKLLSPDLHGATINLVNVESLQAMILNKVQKDEQEEDK